MKEEEELGLGLKEEEAGVTSCVSYLPAHYLKEGIFPPSELSRNGLAHS